MTNIVVGSKEWIEAHSFDFVQENAVTGTMDDTIADSFESCVINSSCPLDERKWCTALGRVHATLMKFSVPATCYYEENESLYAISSSLLCLDNSVRCENVTIFPPGDDWISLACQCIGQNASDFLPSCTSSLSSSSDFGTIETVELICELLTQQVNERVTFNRDITRLLLEVFSN